MIKTSYRIINSITIYRIVAAPFLIFLAFTKNLDCFKWLLAVSFLTDAIDGYLARKYKVTSILGTKLDSIGDDLTILAAIAGLFQFEFQFVKSNVLIVSILLGLYIFQTIIALIRYGKISSFHTYLAKIAAVLQSAFLTLIFFLKEPVYVLFYPAVVITFLDLTEEIVLVFILPKWQTNVKGLYWILKMKKL